MNSIPLMITIYDAILSLDNVKIPDSVQIKKSKMMKQYLIDLKAYAEQAGVECKPLELRSIAGMVREWKTHNLLYWLHIAREHTKDVDLEYPQKTWKTVFYFIMSRFNWN